MALSWFLENSKLQGVFYILYYVFVLLKFMWTIVAASPI